MRRLASVFKRNDKSKHDSSKAPDADSAQRQPVSRPGVLPRQPSKKGRFLSSITVPTAPPPIPPLDHNHSSASSAGSASVSLQTPDDDGSSHLGAPTPSPQISHRKDAWFSWKSKASPQVVPPTQSPPLQWSISTVTVAPSPHPPSGMNGTIDSDDDTSDSSSSSASSDVPLSSRMKASPSDQMLAPTDYLVALSAGRLTPTLSQPPLYHSPDAPFFPRSMNAVSMLPPSSSLAACMHRKHLLARLQRHDLSPADRHMVLSFGSRPASRAESRFQPQPDEGARYDLKHVLPHSRGLRRWTARPYFEERVAVWAPDSTSGAVLCTDVKGSGFAVLALDVSEAVELLAGSDDAREGLDTGSPPISPASAPSSGSVSDFAPLPEKRWLPPILPPSQRHQFDADSVAIVASPSSPVSTRSTQPSQPPRSVSMPALPPSSSTLTLSTSTTSTIMPLPQEIPSPTPKREVRFTPNITKEDKVPKDYVLRIQRNKEEKARFLREEQRRREHEAERLKHEQERRRWEEERQKWEKEKRAMEEERQRKSYSDELAAARARRGAQHALPAHSQSSRDFRELYSRPVYDRRPVSETIVGANRPRESSVTSSRQGGSSGHASTPRTPSGSRPPSTYSAASTDDHRARVSRRMSNVSDAPSLRSTNSMPAYGWPGVPPVPVMPTVAPMMAGYGIPMMPMLPQFAVMPMDMPLLPPNAPFMMHGNKSRSRTSSRTSSSRNASPSRSVGLPASSNNNHSSERVGAPASANRGRAHRRTGSGEQQVPQQHQHAPQQHQHAPQQHQQHQHAPNMSRTRSNTATAATSSYASARPSTLSTQNSWTAPAPAPYVPRSTPLPRRSTAFA